MTRGQCWEIAHAATTGLPSFLLHRERDRRFAELLALPGTDPTSQVERTALPRLREGRIVGGVWAGAN